MSKMAKLAEQVDRLTIQHLIDQAREAVETMPHVIRSNRDIVAYALSIDILRFFLGDEWTTAHVLGDTSHSSNELNSNRHFLRVTSEGGGLADSLHMIRVRSLSQTLFNLQGTVGLNERIDLLRRGSLESALAEFECLSFLAQHKFDLRFISPTQRRGFDYEAEITTPQGCTICCEVKAKLESTTPSATALADSIAKARKQLPKDRPSMVMVRVPGPWIAAVDGTEIEKTINALLRNSNRIVAIGIVSEHVVKRFRISDSAWQIVFSVFLNSRSTFYNDDIAKAIDQIASGNREYWPQLHEIAGSAIFDAIGNTMSSSALQLDSVPKLSQIAVVGVNAERGRDLPLNYSLALSVEHRAEWSDVPGSELTLYLYHTFTLSNLTSDPGEGLFTLTAAFLSTYVAPEVASRESFDAEAFAMTTGLFYVWPYWQEFGQSTMMRMGLQPVRIDILTAERLPLPMCEPAFKSAKEARPHSVA